MENKDKKRQGVYLDLSTYAKLQEDAKNNHRTAPKQAAYIISIYYANYTPLDESNKGEENDDNA